MFAYYLLYHVLNVSNKWVVLFNSFFYSTTHMINPVIYFSLNKDMRAQLIRAISDFLHWLCCVAGDARLHAAGASSIYGRVKRGGGESSSGGSPLRKSSPNDLNSSAQPGGGWTLRYLVASYCARRTSIVPRDCWNRLSAFIYRQPLQQTKTKNNTKISTAVIQNKDGNYQTSVVALTTEMAEEINGRNAKQNNFDENSDTISSGGGDNLNNNNNRLTPFRKFKIIFKNRLPTSCTTKRNWHQITLNTQNSSASERRHLLKINSNPPPSVVSAPSCIEQCQPETPTQQIQDSNNNIGIIIVNNNIQQNVQKKKSKNLTDLALNLVRAVSREFNEEGKAKNKIFERIKDRNSSLFLNSKNYISSEPNSSFNLERINKYLEEDFERKEKLNETLPISDFCFNNKNENNENINEENEDNQNEIEEDKNNYFSSKELNKINKDSSGAISLDLVENWSVKESQESQLDQKCHRETLDGLSRLRGLGSFLAEQLSNEADKCDKKWAIARRQRKTLLDSLVLALKEESEENGENGEKLKENLNKKFEKLNSLKIEQKQQKRHSNGWLFADSS
uniref:G_PROTEIN_RECEP_F1_2 domain-containing protein n=1 Tax=Meloidogyne hapla TaxID=6305 RepID=A0A1I8BXA2_MELHA